jgi:ATPase subunit of ABC transporter with duplicated ATPase domains
MHLVLDEPTANLDIESSEVLEKVLDGFDGSVIAVSHDRTFLANLDRLILITDDGEVYALPDFDVALAGLTEPTKLASTGQAAQLNRVRQRPSDSAVDHDAVAAGLFGGVERFVGMAKGV